MPEEAEHFQECVEGLFGDLARAVGAELFLTRDREILDTADVNDRPFPMTPRSFVNQSRRF